MSSLRTNTLQIGQSGTTTNNFVLTAAQADGTLKLQRGVVGATTQNILTVDAAGTLNTEVPLTVSGGAINRYVSNPINLALSGSAVDNTNIPTWVSKITINFFGVSTTGTALVLLHLINNGVLVTSGYTGAYVAGVAGAASTGGNYGIAFAVSANNTAGDARYGTLTLYKVTATGSWVLAGTVGTSAAANVTITGGSVSAPQLTGIRISTTDAFDGGGFSVVYEG